MTPSDCVTWGGRTDDTRARRLTTFSCCTLICGDCKEEGKGRFDPYDETEGGVSFRGEAAELLVFLGKQETGCAAIGFRDDPELDATACAVDREKTASVA